MQNNSTYNLFLDDERVPLDCLRYTYNTIYIDVDWVIVRNYNDFVSYISNHGLPEIISFDHDLADIHYRNCNHVDKMDYESLDEKTGYHCAKWLIDFIISNDLELPKILIHTMNPVGRENIDRLFKNFKKHFK